MLLISRLFHWSFCEWKSFSSCQSMFSNWMSTWYINVCRLCNCCIDCCEVDSLKESSCIIGVASKLGKIALWHACATSAEVSIPWSSWITGIFALPVVSWILQVKWIGWCISVRRILWSTKWGMSSNNASLAYIESNTIGSWCSISEIFETCSMSGISTLLHCHWSWFPEVLSIQLIAWLVCTIGSWGVDSWDRLKNWCCAVRLSTAPSPSWACSVTSAMWWSSTFVWSSSV